MKITTGCIIIIIGVAILGFACFVMEMLYPRPEKTELCAWYGEIHWEVPYELPPEYDNPHDPSNPRSQDEPKDDKAAQ